MGPSGRTHRTGYGPERGEALSGIGRVPAPGIPARVVTPLQHILLPLEASVFEAHPPVEGGKQGGEVRPQPSVSGQCSHSGDSATGNNGQGLEMFVAVT